MGACRGLCLRFLIMGLCRILGSVVLVALVISALLITALVISRIVIARFIVEILLCSLLLFVAGVAFVVTILRGIGSAEIQLLLLHQVTLAAATATRFPCSCCSDSRAHCRSCT